jgi:hypothetical protein
VDERFGDIQGRVGIAGKYDRHRCLWCVCDMLCCCGKKSVLCILIFVLDCWTDIEATNRHTTACVLECYA